MRLDHLLSKENMQTEKRFAYVLRSVQGVDLFTLFNLEGTLRVCTRWGFSSAGRAPALQAGGQRFDPANLHHTKKTEGSQRNGPIAQLARAHD